MGLTGTQDLRSTGLTSLYNSNVFANCTNVKEWMLPTSFGAYFGNYAFSNNTTLSAITLPSTLTAVAAYCFNNNYALNHITIPSKVVALNDHSFYGCRMLSSVNYTTSALTAVN